ncbi:MAG: rhomboid family intramembrane serine protease [Bryobacteraceae bacterium]|jgi:rhomboid protease GluP
MDSRRMCPQCRAFITTKDKVCPYCNERVGPRAIDRREPGGLIGGLIPHARFNTTTILLLNFGLYLATTIYSMKAGNEGAFSNIDSQTLVAFGAKFGPYIALGQWWRLVTAGFLHGGLLHILMNSWVLWDLGSQVEEVYGASRMWVIYLVSSICGFYLSDLWNPMVPSVGASAGLFGMIGAMIALGVTHQGGTGDAVKSMYIRWAIYGLLFSFLPGIDMAAHIGGLAGGFGLAYLAGLPRYEGAPVETFWKGGAWICLAITALSFLKMYLWFTRMAQ